MIQRIQSIFLLLCGACFGAEFAFPFAKSDQNVQGIFLDGQYGLSDHPVLQILAGLGVLLSIVAITMFKKRNQQLRLTYLLTTIGLLLPLVAILIFVNQSVSLDAIGVEDSVGLYLPLGIIVFSILASRYIKKDENLVRSMDRLR